MKPIELKSFLPKTYEMSKVHQNSRENAKSQQNILISQNNQEMKDIKQKVIKKSKAENMHMTIKEGNKRNKDNNNRNSQKKRRKLKKKRNIDIKI